MGVSSKKKRIWINVLIHFVLMHLRQMLKS